ncbi:MAG: DNA polymerase III subunit delta [Prevotella sp.]|nr:DNA polymerase III subunit delta [Bacteroides sp.]MCM1366368.1 DNA polymerase III subunit delta [Prevotella sp.]MCM1436274.1 DNA polymerase III subunit delta [Prevotella sp.]
MKFSDVTGNDNIKSELTALSDSNRLPHTMMLTGPSGIGKLNMALAFAQYIHCENPSNGDSCGKCDACRQHSSVNFPDLHFVYPVVKKNSKSISSDYAREWREFITSSPFASLRDWGDAIDAGNTAPTIYVDESEEIIRIASLSSYSADYKIFIIWLPEKMQPATANKLLKILEEPFENTLFLLVSDEPALVLPTILSRAQRFEMKRLDEDYIAQWLVSKYFVNADLAQEAAHLSQGSPSKALQIANNDSETSAHRSLFQEMMRMAYSCNGLKLKKISEDIAAMGRQKAQRFFDYSLRQIRENFIANLSQPQLNLFSSEEEAFSRKFAPFIHARNVQMLADLFSKASSDIARNANAKIVCFDMMLSLMKLLRMSRQ